MAIQVTESLSFSSSDGAVHRCFSEQIFLKQMVTGKNMW